MVPYSPSFNPESDRDHGRYQKRGKRIRWRKNIENKLELNSPFLRVGFPPTAGPS